ncbi:MAG: NAD(P)-dependent glycerol-3-phosphate dehydrogenase [Candidatus Rokubacteria bacterium]|nr:NAD(P)-dependent glycerol-3-phosphate dehydrogenase [Candidatus Rokubacteria bacterium]
MTASGGVAVVGGGGWGTALAIHLARLGVSPRLWVREPELVELMRSDRENPWYLPGIVLPPEVHPTPALSDALDGADLILLVAPSHAFAAVVEAARPSLRSHVPLLSATKGLEPATARRMSEILAQLVPASPVAVLSGPTFAREVALGRPTAAVVASADPDLAVRVQRRLASREFRLYTNRDVLGVELGGALKNIIAIATGICDGLGLGENARAGLITRGLAEITRLGVALGASPLTFAGLAGLGDLVLTCTGSLSRNRALGLALAGGKSLAEAQGASRMVAEGVNATEAALRLARRAAVSLPICHEVGAVLFEGKSPQAALAALLEREVRPEEEPGLTESLTRSSRTCRS